MRKEWCLGGEKKKGGKVRERKRKGKDEVCNIIIMLRDIFFFCWSVWFITFLFFLLFLVLWYVQILYIYIFFKFLIHVTVTLIFLGQFSFFFFYLNLQTKLHDRFFSFSLIIISYVGSSLFELCNINTSLS